MQTHGGAPATAAIETTGGTRYIYVELLIDWNDDGLFNHALSNMSQYVESATTAQALAGSAPTEVMLIEGHAAAELSVVLTGRYDGLAMDAIFSPYNGWSPLYTVDTTGREVIYRIGIETTAGVVWYDQFRGMVRNISPTSGQNDVVLTALDRAEILRVPVTMTDWAIMEHAASRGIIKSQLMSSQWVIDHCLKFCDTSSSPWRFPMDAEWSTGGRVLFWLSGDAGIAPNIGWVDGSTQNQFPDSENTAVLMYHSLGQAHPASPDPAIRPEMLRAMRDWGLDQNVFWASDRKDLPFGGCRYLGFTLQTQNYAGSDWYLTMPDSQILEYTDYDDQSISIFMGAGQAWVRFVNGETVQTFNTPRFNISAATPYIRIRVFYDFQSNPNRMRIFVGAVDSGWVTSQARYFAANDDKATRGRIRLWRKVSMSDIYVSVSSALPAGTTAPEEGVAASNVAVVDPGKNRLSFLPDRFGKQAWDIIGEVAAAEFGAAFWDEHGVFRFWNADTITAKQLAPVRTLTRSQAGSLGLTSSLDSIRNHYVVTAKKKRIQSGLVFEARDIDEFYIPNGQWGMFQVWVDGVATPNSAQLPRLATIGGGAGPWGANDLVTFGGVIQQLVAGVWSELASGPTTVLAFAYRSNDGSTRLQIWNGYSNPIRFATDAGQPALRWNGSKVVAYDDQLFQLDDPASVARYRRRTLPLSSDWYQEFYDFAGAISTLLTKTTRPIPSTDNITIDGDPRLQLGDAMNVADPEGLGELLKIQIQGIRRTFSRSGGLVDNLSVEMIRHTLVGIWDSPQYGRWDKTLIWGA